MIRIWAQAVCLATAFNCASCALLGKSEALDIHYFSPEASSAGSKPSSPTATSKTAELRLGRVTAASYLGSRIVYRDSQYELNFYEERRWAENPDVYLRRALSRALFEERRVRRIVSGGGPTLEVELSEFAEVRGNPALARVRVSYRLYDGRLTRREATITVEMPIAAEAGRGQSPELPVRVMADALNTSVTKIVDEVVAELSSLQHDNATPRTE